MGLGHILDKLGNFPLKGLIRKWLEAGYLENDIFVKTRTGTPQGGIISPLLANIALHGMEEALNIKYKPHKHNGKYYYTNPSKYVVVKYADDFVVLCRTLEDANAVYGLLDEYLNERGLTLASDKTRITHINDGFDFLGFNIYNSKTRNGYYKVGYKTSEKKSKKKKQNIKEYIKLNRDTKAKDLIKGLNRKLVGYYNYYGISFNDWIYEIYQYTLNQLKKWLSRRSQRGKISWNKMKLILEFKPLVKPKVTYPLW